MQGNVNALPSNNKCAKIDDKNWIKQLASF